MGFASQRHSLPSPSHPPVAIPKNYPLQITVLSSLPGATIGVAYSISLSNYLQITGGVPPYMWTIISGSLPPGLSMDGSGNITGTPTTSGTFSFTIQIVDPLGNSGSINVGVEL